VTIQLLSVLVLGLMCRSELNLAAFAHPTLNRQPVVTHIPGPVPINNRISRWTADSLADDWRAQEHRWDLYD